MECVGWYGAAKAHGLAWVAMARGAEVHMELEGRWRTFAPMKDDMLLNEVIAKARSWTKPPHDNETRNLVQEWLDGCATDPESREALVDAFYTDLSFGTGGLRGKMGPGTNRINPTTIARATQGLANHLRKVHGPNPASGPWRVAIACDSRHLSQTFAQITACLLYTSPSPRDRQKSRMPSSA